MVTAGWRTILEVVNPSDLESYEWDGIDLHNAKRDTIFSSLEVCDRVLLVSISGGSAGAALLDL